ncbi:MAG: hypothetical protein J7M01_01555 [Candidatus Marinimicrobia bacterium]|nr:hypothetical protein [Candidatus Neomarinimicrobiota bacterium]
MNKEKIISKFKELRPKYERLANEISEGLKTKIDKAGIRITPLVWRVKTADSLLNKIKRKEYSEPLSEITDLAGVRVVCMYESDIKRLEQMIQEEFNVCERVDKYKEAGSDKMGYLGIHFVVQLKENYSGPRYDGLHVLKCEIQVRTILQDAWALISHHLVYKDESSIPNKIKRDLNNVASLLEIAQGVFDSSREKIETYVSEIHKKQETPNEFLSQPVDFETLYAYTQWKYKGLPVSEKWHNRLLLDLDLKKYLTLKKIDEVVEKTKDAVMAYQKENPDWFKTGTAYITKSLGFGDLEFRRKHPFGQKTRDAFPKYEHLIKDR